MAVLLTTKQTELIETIAKNNGFSEYEIIANPGSVKGDNYLGIITSIVVQNSEKKLELILKSAQTNELFRQGANIRKAFLKEIYTYKTLFEEFDKYQNEYNIDNPFKSYAKFYGSCEEEGQECLVMENMKTKGYELWSRKMPMTPEHIALVMSEYGKFHAISLAMKHKNPDTFQELTKDLKKNIFEEQSNAVNRTAFVRTVIESGCKAVQGNDVATKAIERFESRLKNFFENEVNRKENQIVVNHGDCWNNNILFKSENVNGVVKPSKICLLDWQIIRIGSPAADLAYFFYTSSSREVLHDYEKYLKIYYKSVTQSLQNFGCDPEEIFPYSLLKEHWKIYSISGLNLALLILKLMLSEADEVPDFENMKDQAQDFFKETQLKDNTHYNKRILDIVLFMVDNNFI